MNSQDYRNLQEAYLNVYQEIDEAFKPLPTEKLDNKIKKLAVSSDSDSGTRQGNIGRVRSNIGKSQKTKSFGSTESAKRKSAKHHAKSYLRQHPYSTQDTKDKPDLYTRSVGYYIDRGEDAKKKHIQRMNKEQVDLYDIILSYLLDEGYAETQEAAEVMMVNMSEEWREEILDEKVLGQDPESRKAASKERTTGETRRLPPSRGKEYANNQKKSISYMNKLTKNNKIIPGMAHEEVEEFDEGIGSAIKGLFAKKKKPEAPEPLSRGAELRQKYGTETSPKQQILAKTRKKAEEDEKEYGDSPYSKSVATNSREAHNTRLRAGYSLYRATGGSGGEGGSGEIGSGNAARRRAEKLKLNNSYDLFDYMMEYLIDEGYADTNENALVIMTNMSEEWREDILTEVSQDEFRAGMMKAAAKMPSDVRTPSRKELFGSEEERSKIKLPKGVVNPTPDTSANIRKSSEYSSPRASRGLPAAGYN
jgi:hypothetical protein